MSVCMKVGCLGGWTVINPNEYEPLSHSKQECRVAGPTESNEAVDEEPRRLTPVYTYGSIN